MDAVTVRNVSGAAFILCLHPRLFSQARPLGLFLSPALGFNRGLLLALGPFNGLKPGPLCLLSSKFQFQFAAFGGFALFLGLSLYLGTFTSGGFLCVTLGLLGGSFGNAAVPVFLFSLGGFLAETGKFSGFGFALGAGFKIGAEY